MRAGELYICGAHKVLACAEFMAYIGVTAARRSSNQPESNMDKQIQVGSNVKFLRPDGKVCEDVVRMLFTQDVLLEPYARNQKRPAAVLTQHSWTFIDNIVEVL
jgi:hypothetical protein